MATPWWSQLNLPPDEIESLVLGTGWLVKDLLREGDEHLVVLRREGSQ